MEAHTGDTIITVAITITAHPIDPITIDIIAEGSSNHNLVA